MELKEIEQKSNYYRSRILNNKSNHSYEFRLVQEIVREYKEICNGKLKRYPYIFKYEYCVIQGQSNTGKGDLILTDGQENYMVIEVKYLDSYGSGKTAKTRRTKKRKHVKEQVKKYSKAFAKTHPEAKSIKGMIYTNLHYQIYEFNMETGSIKLIYNSFWKDQEVLRLFIDKLDSYT